MQNVDSLTYLEQRGVCLVLDKGLANHDLAKGTAEYLRRPP